MNQLFLSRNIVDSENVQLVCFISRSSIMSIFKIHAREIFDSRGNPTVEVDLYTDKGRF